MKNVQHVVKLITDDNKAYPGFDHTFVRNDYEKHPEHLLWLNSVVSNLKKSSRNISWYAIKYLILSLAEFEWRFNHRKFDNGNLKSSLRTTMAATTMTCKKTGEALCY